MTSQKVLKLSDFDFTKSGLYEGLITPHLAAEILELNWANNRPIGTARVIRYATEMTCGRWMATEAIQFSTDGKLIQGQHRMSAVIRCGQAQPFYVQTGVNPKCAELLDQGKARNTLDIASIRGVKLKSSHISVMRMMILGANPAKAGHHHMPPAQIVALCEMYFERLDFCLNHAGSKGAINYSPVLAAVFAAYPHENHQRLDDFLYCWQKGLVLKGACDNSAVVLRNDYYKEATKFSTSQKFRISFFLKSQLAVKKFLANEYSKVHRTPSDNQWDLSEFYLQNLLKKLNEN